MSHQGLRTAIYPVNNLAEAREFYTRLFETTPYFDEPFYVGFNIGGYELGLIPDGEPGGIGVIAYWAVEDIQSAWDRALKLGATAISLPKNVGDDIWVAVVADPDGNAIGWIVNPHFKSAG